MPDRLRKWNGWGYEGEGIPTERVARWLKAVEPWLQVSPKDYQPPVPLESLQIPPSRIALEIPGFQGALLATDYERALHAAGRSFGDLVRLRTGQDLCFPDAVAYPEDEADLLRLLEVAEHRSIALIPYGGGTSVVGGVEPAVPPGFQGVLSVDLARMNRIRFLDPSGRRVRAQAGIRGPDLEEALRAHGLAFRHYPQSFQMSTLGGWIATRAAGHFSTAWGRIEHRVESLRVLTPRGVLETREVPASASGPDVRSWVVGSEGAFGFITEAVVRAVRPPVAKRAGGFRFPEFSAGLEAMRRILQAGLTPAVLRLLDEYEVAISAALAGHPLEPGALLHISLEIEDLEDAHRVEAEWRSALRWIERAGGIPAPEAVETWKRAYFEQPYWRDVMIDFGLLLDTVETAVPWSRVEETVRTVRERLIQRIDRWSPVGGVMCRVTHGYPDGCALYFTFFARPSREALREAWRDLQRTALEAFLECGGTITHHHGTGRDFRSFLVAEHGPLALDLLQRVKAALDPAGIMNPGVLVAPAPHG
jgi:alkyldihydroxyacetonephosphate synthase